VVTVVNKTIGSGGDYSTLSAWEAATDVDISVATGSDEQHNGKLLAILTVAQTIAGATTDAVAYRNLTYDDATLSTYDPIAGTGAGVDTSAAICITENETFFRATGILLRAITSSSTKAVIKTTAYKGYTLTDCTLEQHASSSGGSCVKGAAEKFYGCLFMCRGTSGHSALRIDSGYDLLEIVNCTGYSHGTCDVGLGGGTTTANTVIINNAFAGFGTTDYGSGTYSLGTLSNNMGSDTTAPGTSAQDSVTDTDVWTDPANDDFTMKSGGAGIDNGTDGSSYLTTDLAENSHGSNGTWEIGCYDLIVASGIGPESYYKTALPTLLRM
jgi:hypothetical protein